ncbi:M15 family metallopeptidase [Glaciihabitans sp. UYNi722]|uniref:M15 family metallopeptidase n=1 Tax=Glaciihabitans sp. UYNi722 TaxID=3156344 RepID=UPI003394C568
MHSPRILRSSALIVTVALVVSLAACAPDPAPEKSPKPSASASAEPTPTPTPTPTFDKGAHSLDDPTSIWVVVNKVRPLQPNNYVPSDLVSTPVPHISAPLMRPKAATALEAMFAASTAEGGGALQIQNSYRSYTVQVNTHNRLVASLGEAKADAQSARPGYSEHQTGLVADIAASPSKCDIQACFGQTPQGIWLAANAWRFGYLLRYPADKTAVTGYIYEPWHFRYIGVELAAEMHAKAITTLEEFFGLPGAPDYAP